MPVEASYLPILYGSPEVARLFSRRVSEIQLQKWDEAELFSPTYYVTREEPNVLLTRLQRDAHIQRHGASRANPRRRYTFPDLLLLRTFLYVIARLTDLGTGPIVAVRESAVVVRELRRITAGRMPPFSRLLFLGADIYLLSNALTHCLTRPGQLAFQLSTDEILGDVTARVVGTLPPKEERDSEEMPLAG